MIKSVQILMEAIIVLAWMDMTYNQIITLVQFLHQYHFSALTVSIIIIIITHFVSYSMSIFIRPKTH